MQIMFLKFFILTFMFFLKNVIILAVLTKKKDNIN